MADIDSIAGQMGLSDLQALYRIEAQEAFSCKLQGQFLLLTCTRFQSIDLLTNVIARVEQVKGIQNSRVMGYVGHTVVGEYLAVVEEYGKTVWRDIEERKEENKPFTDAYLLVELAELITALAELQEQGLSHGAISPLSLYLTPAGIKISYCHPFPTSLISSLLLVMEDIYLSPVKRFRSLSTFHNPYKSDVYSLGTVFLAMSLLRHPELQPFNRLQQAINTELMGLQDYPLLQGKLRTMLSVNDMTRPDFTSLIMQERAASAPIPVPKPGCLQCKADFPVSGPPLPLWCTFIHGFCSTKCGELYVLEATQHFKLDIITVKCNICGKLLESENLNECVGGKANMEQIKAVALSPVPVCVGCYQVGKETFQLVCGCYFCKSDLSTALSFYNRSPQCSNCRQPLDPNQLRHILYKTPYAGGKK